MKVATAVINRQALKHNLQQIRRLAPHSQVMAVVKANAYGHGSVETAKALASADAFGVARLEEALTLRAQGVAEPIVLLEGFFSAQDLPILAANNFETVIHNIEQLALLEQSQLARPITVWMKLDSGMHRLGVRPERANSFYQRLLQCRHVIQPVRLLSHFCRADEPHESITLEQSACFDRFVIDKPGPKSLAASAGILYWPQSHRDWVRPGIILYGVCPQADSSIVAQGFRPAMTLVSSLIAVREHLHDEGVGYGQTWHSKRDTRLGVVGIGYGDGYPRDIASGTPVYLNGRQVPIVGRVSMDMLTVDLGPEATDRVGDEVVLWGEQLPVEHIAQYNQLSPYELITRLTRRVKLEYVDC